MKRILILGRVGCKNLGDAIIIDTCEYALKQLAEKNHKKISITALDMFSEDKANIRRVIKDYDVVVFPGGGVNSLRFAKAAKTILKGNKTTQVFFNGNGISKTNSDELKALLMELMNDKNTVQVTTRGDFETAKSYVTAEKKYPVEHILDPAIFSAQTYKISRDKNSELIGVGLIRPEIFKENGRDLEVDDVMKMYVELFDELDKRGYKWELFCNGTNADYNFAKSVLEESGRSVEKLAPQPRKNKDLIKLVAKYKGIIAARFHANIIATSLEVPNVALVWNDKMLGFAELTGTSHRYICDKESLLNASRLADVLEKGIEEGFDKNIIDKAKLKTKKEMAHILGFCLFH